MALEAENVDRFEPKSNAMTTSKLLLYITVCFNLILQGLLLWVTARRFSSTCETANQIGQIEFALQGIKSKLKEIIADKELFNTKLSSKHCLCHRKTRRQALELKETLEELEELNKR